MNDFDAMVEAKIVSIKANEIGDLSAASPEKLRCTAEERLHDLSRALSSSITELSQVSPSEMKSKADVWEGELKEAIEYQIREIRSATLFKTQNEVSYLASRSYDQLKNAALNRIDDVRFLDREVK